MTQPITILVPIKLAPGVTETDFLAASDTFQQEFASLQPGLLRRELVRNKQGEYLDIVQFESTKHAEDVMEKEKTSAVCHAFFSLIDASAPEGSDGISFYDSLCTYS